MLGPSDKRNSTDDECCAENSLQAKTFTKQCITQKGGKGDAEADKGIGLRHANAPQHAKPNDRA